MQHPSSGRRLVPVGMPPATPEREHGPCRFTPPDQRMRLADGVSNQLTPTAAAGVAGGRERAGSPLAPLTVRNSGVIHGLVPWTHPSGSAEGRRLGMEPPAHALKIATNGRTCSGCHARNSGSGICGTLGPLDKAEDDTAGVSPGGTHGSPRPTPARHSFGTGSPKRTSGREVLRGRERLLIAGYGACGDEPSCVEIRATR